MAKTMEDLIFESLEGKYFQKTLNPLEVFEAPTHVQPRAGGNGSYIPVRIQTTKENLEIYLPFLHNYHEISKESYERILKLYSEGNEDQIKKEFENDIPLSRAKKKGKETILLNENVERDMIEYNEPNLSAQNRKNMALADPTLGYFPEEYRQLIDPNSIDR